MNSAGLHIEVTKKQEEARLFEEARHISGLFGDGRLEFHERPDFLWHTSQGSVGLEITELRNERSSRLTGRLNDVTKQACELYGKSPNLPKVNVSVVFDISHRDDLPVRKSAALLSEFVAKHAIEGGGFDDYLPDGFSYIGIHPTATNRAGQWLPTTAHNAELITKPLIESCLRKKARKLDQYRRSISEVWLLMVYNVFDEGHAHFLEDGLKDARLDLAFTRAFLFVRGSAGMGKVIALQNSHLKEISHS
jgi:hypothetical protein